MTISILANIFCFPNSGYFDKTGVFQQTRMLTTAIWKCGKFKSKLLCIRKGGRTHTARWYFMLYAVSCLLAIPPFGYAQSITELKNKAEDGDVQAQLALAKA